MVSRADYKNYYPEYREYLLKELTKYRLVFNNSNLEHIRLHVLVDFLDKNESIYYLNSTVDEFINMLEYIQYEQNGIIDLNQFIRQCKIDNFLNND